jgi:hypothetical protein
MNDTIFFNAHHAPVGAFATFTLGCTEARGGMGLELGGPANENIFIGVETRAGGAYEALPFFQTSADASRRYDVAAGAEIPQGLVRKFAQNEVKREFRLGSDSWTAGDLTFTIYSPVKSAPDPLKASRAALMEAYVPAVFAELTIDNTKGTRPRTAFFAREGSDARYNTRRLDDVSRGKYTGVGQGPVTAIVSDSPGVRSGINFTLDKVLKPDRVENLTMGLGGVGALMATVPAKSKKTFRFAICFHRDGTVTSGLAAKYFYLRFFPSIEDVATYALKNFPAQKAHALADDKRLAKSRLTPVQQFHVCHSVRAYYGSTEFLEAEKRPFWVVNEGEYRMLNTFDLTVDHLFFEIERNPWVVRDQLEWFVRRYSYVDKVRLPGEAKEYPGGISFSHDMGIGNCVSRPGHSSYEQFGLHGCFSHMTHEQLVNWVCCAVGYVRATHDKKWLKKYAKTFKDCLTSLINRDHPDPKKRDGIMSADSSRCMGGSEITTYDSLDPSLGQARNNLYLAVKTWAAYLGLVDALFTLGDEKGAGKALDQARLASATITAHLRDDGFVPAILGEGNESRIIPAVEGLVFPWLWQLPKVLVTQGGGDELTATLKRHLATILKPGTCKFADGGWKLSSTNDNSWLSKIYLCQFVSREVLGFPADPKADEAHRSWLLDEENFYFSWSDQMIAGKARGSKYYPRGVTAWLWLAEKKK